MNKLENTTFIIPLRIESGDRMRNIITVLCFLLYNFDSKVIVKEVDSQKVFEPDVLPQITEFLGDRIQNLTHIFEHSDNQVFHRTRILNEMIHMSTTEVVVNYDCDIVLRPETYYKSVDMIVNDGYDLIYPYGKGSYQQQVFATDEIVSEFITISVQRSPHWNDNWKLYEYLNTASVDELKDYYQTQKYLKKYPTKILLEDLSDG